MNDYLKKSKESWSRASTFSVNKEDVYPEHTLAQQFDNHHDKDVLEYGCGAGSDTLSYLRRGNVVTACDIVPTNIDTTKRNVLFNGFAEQATFVLLDKSVPLPLGDSTFDVVTSHGVVHHIINAPDVVKEFYRVTKPGGMCYLMLYSEYLFEHHRDTISHLMLSRGITLEEAFCWCTDGEGTPYATPYTEKEGVKLLEDAGYKYQDCMLWLNGFFRTFRAVKL